MKKTAWTMDIGHTADRFRYWTVDLVIFYITLDQNQFNISKYLNGIIQIFDRILAVNESFFS